ncbi:MAG: sodium:solute symporter [Saprospiraceae bacterium]|nr:sodium:solute symporter [Saprospiraceae bacterium]
MHLLDWLIMLGTLLGIVAYGIWKTRNVNNVRSYLLGDKDLPWWTIGLSIMATQASAITFLSTPGQAYEDGMRFAQFYFGMPIAMVILAIFFLPIYYRLNVYTAYEYLEGRFDLKTRSLTAIFFLLQRGMAAGITIYAPAIILSSILEIPLLFTNLFIGVIVIVYTMLGGTKAVSVTQKQQMIVILTGMFAAAIILVFKLPKDVGFGDAVAVAGKMGKLNVVDFEFNLNERYNFWSGILGGTFLFLSYFGTDQSQVQRYLSGKSLSESRLGLLFNGLIKVPMQFLVLFVGILVFVFYQFVQPPLHFNQANVKVVESSEYAADYQALEAQHSEIYQLKETEIRNLITAINAEDEIAITSHQSTIQGLLDQDIQVRKEAKEVIKQANPDLETQDDDYVFISFVMKYLPIGMVGLILAVIFSAAMSSTASELNALATTTIVDLYRRSISPEQSDQHYLFMSKLMTVLWGILALSFAMVAPLADNLIEFVNIIGSLFYGTILGVFLVAFFMKQVNGRAVFWAAICGELMIVFIFWLTRFGYLDLAYLWLNLIGCILVMLYAGFFNFLNKKLG